MLDTCFLNLSLPNSLQKYVKLAIKQSLSLQSQYPQGSSWRVLAMAVQGKHWQGWPAIAICSGNNYVSWINKWQIFFLFSFYSMLVLKHNDATLLHFYRNLKNPKIALSRYLAHWYFIHCFLDGRPTYSPLAFCCWRLSQDWQEGDLFTASTKSFYNWCSHEFEARMTVDAENTYCPVYIYIMKLCITVWVSLCFWNKRERRKESSFHVWFHSSVIPRL